MKNSTGRLLASILLPLAIGATVAGCGDGDNSTAGNGTHMDSPTTAARPTATAQAVDKAFVRQMVPHHESAVDMAQTAQTKADHAEVRALSNDIIAAQQREIAELKSIAKDLGVTPDKPMDDASMGRSMERDARTMGLKMTAMGMSMDMAALDRADPFDQAFLNAMIVHHQGAVAMAKAQLDGGIDARLRKLATAIIAAQNKEVKAMNSWRADWYGKDATTSPAEHDMEDMPGM